MMHFNKQHRSVQLTQNRTGATRERTGREASLLKEVRKVKRVGESEKWVTRPRGGRSKRNFGEKNKIEGGRVKRTKRGSKRHNHVC
jgi:hypothetical protein